jgi:NAD(P)-dependent dehydrogenase (short-subunit alcohol dehydrogenase family)
MKNTVTLVTGAGAGIGRRIAEVFASRGSSVALLDRDESQLSDAVASINTAGGKAIALVADVTRSSDVEQAVVRIANDWGPIDVLVNNAGIVRLGSVTETSEEDWDLVVDVNLKGVFLCSHHVLPGMVEAQSGNIVNVSSVAARGGTPHLAAYSASKAAVANLTTQMAKDYGPAGIRVNCVLPGTIPTDMHRAFYTEDEAESTLEQWARNKPLRRNGTTDDIAAAVAFLASDEANFITGVVLPVDGGASI